MSRPYKTGRRSEEIRRIISEMLLREIKDPRLSAGIVSITGVDLTSDGSYATVYVTVLPPASCMSGAVTAAGHAEDGGSGAALEEQSEDEEAGRREVLEALKKATPVFRREIGRQMMIRRAPELIFKIDTSEDYGRRIDEILNGLDIKPEGENED
ncbi:MAG: ribosome-binding factor A [Eubacterium sp.]|jgi:ribosome-binding factor A